MLRSTRSPSLRVPRAGLRAPDSVSGLAWSGAMSTARLGRLILRLSGGLTEIYPASVDARRLRKLNARASRYADELAAPVDPDVIARTRQPDVKLAGYSDF